MTLVLPPIVRYVHLHDMDTPCPKALFRTTSGRLMAINVENLQKLSRPLVKYIYQAEDTRQQPETASASRTLQSIRMAQHEFVASLAASLPKDPPQAPPARSYLPRFMAAQYDDEAMDWQLKFHGTDQKIHTLTMNQMAEQYDATLDRLCNPSISVADRYWSTQQYHALMEAYEAAGCSLEASAQAQPSLAPQPQKALAVQPPLKRAYFTFNSVVVQQDPEALHEDGPYLAFFTSENGKKVVMTEKMVTDFIEHQQKRIQSAERAAAYPQPHPADLHRLQNDLEQVAYAFSEIAMARAASGVEGNASWSMRNALQQSVVATSKILPKNLRY